MANYRFPPPGENDPIENIHHYVGTRIGSAIALIREGEKPRLGERRDFFLGLLSRYADGTYTYAHTASFSPEIALNFKTQILGTLKSGATIKDLEDLAETLLSAMDRYAVEVGRPEETRQAIKALIDKTKKELIK
ncbi:hypothetical protein HYX08_02550 [Candidatus Woesearchaeota archaeon]|nr:hypothetical protein [Candidatus Woesearchaeota archaeon]